MGPAAPPSPASLITLALLGHQHARIRTDPSHHWWISLRLGACDHVNSYAYRWHQHTVMPFELARTQLCHGQQLRRAKHRTAAREPLRAALATFEQLGTRPWADQARAELQATGETARRRTEPATSRLTPRSSRWPAWSPTAAPTRDIAASLFLSPKTVEFHLRSIHRKLGTSSRAQLVHLLLQQPPTHSG